MIITFFKFRLGKIRRNFDLCSYHFFRISFFAKTCKKKKKIKTKKLSFDFYREFTTIPQREKPKSAAWGPFWGAEKKEGEGGVADGAWSRAIFESVLVSVGGLEKVRRPFFGLSLLKKSSHT